MSLEAAYENPEHPGSYMEELKLCLEQEMVLSLERLKIGYAKKESYTLHKTVRRKLKKNRVLVSQINQQFQADLIDMQSLSEYNEGYNYLLTRICTLLKYTWEYTYQE
ncbi:hypothetical protein AVEN_80820-1 [Araneus ventricosus]|uniref:Uncharacterized protein n=1 Tax=Araneus ventricosus TaxID=182803 RepID=A0A4Y2P001_ARAVE|nr:hypothetical protein AVEN_80820-1 [Araneus ventricosus]